MFCTKTYATFFTSSRLRRFFQGQLLQVRPADNEFPPRQLLSRIWFNTAVVFLYGFSELASPVDACSYLKHVVAVHHA
jgi:hypothetical protein